jgi:hypothetical protein
MYWKDKPFYKNHYLMELAVELTGKRKETIRMMMYRKKWTFAQVILFYLQLTL